MTTSTPLTPKLLREFSWIMATAIAGLFGLLFPLLKGQALPPIPWILAGTFLGLGFVIPQSLGPIYRLWLKLGHVLGWVNSRIILGLIFFAVITPMALVMKILQRDTMARTFDSEISSYRVPSHVRPNQHMGKPY